MPGDVAQKNVLPLLTAAIVCDAAAIDPATNKKSLIGVWDVLWAPEFPTLRPAFLYVRIADAEGRYQLRIEFVKLDSNERLDFIEAELEVTERLASTDFVLIFKALRFPGPGRYEFRIVADGTYFGSTFVDARQVAVEH